MTQATEWKSPLICFISFNCEKTHKVWLKNLWNWLCDRDLMIFDLLAPPQGPRGWGSKKLCCCMCHWCKLLTHQIWLNFGTKFFFDHSTPPPHGTPKSDPWGMTQATEWKSCLICFISFICEKTHKVWFKNLWNWLCNWNLMIFKYIWPFGPSPGTQGVGQKKMCCCKNVNQEPPDSLFVIRDDVIFHINCQKVDLDDQITDISSKYQISKGLLTLTDLQIRVHQSLSWALTVGPDSREKWLLPPGKLGRT